MSAHSRRPIQSAIAVAALRAASCKETDPSIANPDYLAKHFVCGGVYNLLLNLPLRLSRYLIEKITPGSYCYFLARTRFIDHYFKQAVSDNIEQVVILGAGYDSRASRLLSKKHDLTVFEIDLPCTQQDKLQKMRRASISSNAGKMVYIANDFNDASLKDMLRDNGFRFDKPCFFIFEGVSYYIEEQAATSVFQFVGEQCAKGSSIVFDYSLQSFVEGAEDTYGGKKMQQWLRKNNEPFKFGLHVGELDAYLAKSGLSVIEDVGPSEYSPRYLQGQSGTTIGQPLGHLRMAYASNKQ